LLAAIDRVHKKIKLISIMRDLFADIPGYADNRINAAFYYDSRYKNLDLKITFSTIKRNLGIDAEDYVVVDFSGFKKIVEYLGGVNVELTDEEAKYMCSDRVYGIFPRFEAGGGEYLLNGSETLNYCRMRKVSGGDFGRTARQRKVITQIMSQLRGSDLATLYNIAGACADHISTNLSAQEMNGYVRTIMPYAKTTGYLTGGAYTATEVIIEAAAPSKLSPGYSASVIFSVPVSDNAILLPYECVARDGEQLYVLALMDGVITRCDVKTGWELESEVEILDGIDKGVPVLLDPDPLLEGKRARN